MTGKRIIWLTIGYMGVFSLALVLFYLLPLDNVKVDKMSEKEINEFFIEMNEFYNTLMEGKLDPKYDQYKKRENTYPFYEDHLKIITEKDLYDLDIFVEMKNTKDSAIDIIQYQQKTIINGMDLSDRFAPRNVVIDGNQLKFVSSEKKKIIFTMFDKDFTVTQFSKEKSYDRGITTTGGQEIIYLRIPASVRLIYDKDFANIHFVNH